jgi:hypothetical protein
MSEIEKKPESMPSKAIDGFAASVELPEGHQLILGELPPGTVVEVATWQGVGRPDDSANRFLLTADGPGLKKRRIRESQALESTQPLSVEPSSTVLAQERVNTTHSQDFLGVHDAGTPKGSELELKPAKSTNKLVNFGKGLFAFAAVVSLFSVVLNMLGVSVTIPTEGAQTSFGKVTDSLVFYKRSTAVENKVALVSSSKIDGVRRVIVGASTSFGASSVGISTTQGMVLVDPNTVVGKSFLVLPYAGVILKPLFN